MPSRSARDSTSYQPARGERPAVSTKDGRHLRIGDTGRLAVAINDTAAEPGAAIGDRDESVAVRLDVDCRDSAEGRIFRRQFEPAAKLQVPEPDPRRIAIVE